VRSPTNVSVPHWNEGVAVLAIAVILRRRLSLAPACGPLEALEM